MLTRYASAATSGALMTFGLLFVMQLLITIQPGALTDPREQKTLKFVRIPPPKPVVHKKEPIDKAKLTESKLPPPRIKYTGGAETIGVPSPDAVAPPPTGLPAFASLADGPLVALVRVAPVYPARALTNELEGFVVVQFDVTAEGRVANIVVLESSHSVFEKPAIKAAERFKFKPQVVDGLALASYGIQNRFRFSIDDQ